MGLNKEYWEKRYKSGETGWDTGAVSPPLKAFFDRIEDLNTHILIPGCGNAYEAEYLFKKGFKNVFILDIALQPLQNLKKRLPEFPTEHLIHFDFFSHTGQYDLIIEQTFFCALDPSMRESYVKHCHKLLKPGGVLAGLLFNAALNSNHPPFGGSKKEYEKLFSRYFVIEKMETAHNSIIPRAGRELFFIARKD